MKISYIGIIWLYKQNIVMLMVRLIVFSDYILIFYNQMISTALNALIQSAIFNPIFFLY